MDPDFFPPTINAILNLAERMDEVVVISRNNSVADYPYPSNVQLKKIGKRVPVREMEKQPLWKKLYYFFDFSFSLLRECKNKRTDLVLLYDPLALFALFLLKPFGTPKKLWYHNHDLVDVKNQRKYSLGYWAAKFERKGMNHIHYFSLPSRERLSFYPHLKAEIPVFIIPNYPSLKVYKVRPPKSAIENGKVRIIYQGFIGPGHGFEMITKLLTERINGYQLELVLKGSVSADYKSALDQLAKEYNVSAQVKWVGISAYSDIPMLTRSCDIGIGINVNEDNVSLTQGTSSNKIYEYAASGLPVVVNDSDHFRKYLGNYSWTYFTENNLKSLKEVILSILNDLPAPGECAHEAFKEFLNFESCFIPVLELVSSSDRGI